MWSEEDRAYELAYQQYEREKCSGCGQDIHASMARENQLVYKAEPVRCHACAATQRAIRKFTKEGGDDAGLMARIIRAP